MAMGTVWKLLSWADGSWADGSWADGPTPPIIPPRQRPVGSGIVSQSLLVLPGILLLKPPDPPKMGPVEAPGAHNTVAPAKRLGG